MSQTLDDGKMAVIVAGPDEAGNFEVQVTDNDQLTSPGNVSPVQCSEWYTDQLTDTIDRPTDRPRSGVHVFLFFSNIYCSFAIDKCRSVHRVSFPQQKACAV